MAKEDCPISTNDQVDIKPRQGKSSQACYGYELDYSGILLLRCRECHQRTPLGLLDTLTTFTRRLFKKN